MKKKAPAKLNLFLHITGRRSDGYHLLQSVFQRISLCDELTFSVLKHATIRVHGNASVPEQQDLIYRAARLLQMETDTMQGVEIRCQKNIPFGSGMGGGSSDAATTLRVLNELWQLDVSTEKLMQLGLKLGADVPFFLQDHAAIVEGIGESITPIVLPPQTFLCVTPRVEISTAELFAHPDLNRSMTPVLHEQIREWMRAYDTPDCPTGNAFEPIVRSLYPEIDAVFARLSRYGTPHLSGTGATVFLVCENALQANEIAETLIRTGWQVFVARS